MILKHRVAALRKDAAKPALAPGGVVFYTSAAVGFLPGIGDFFGWIV